MDSEAELMEITIRFFTSDHCGFCRAAKSVLDTIKQNFGETIRVVEINIDENPRAAIEEAILALPVIIVGSWKFVGVPDKDDIQTAILNSFGNLTLTNSEGTKEILQEGR